MKEVDIAWAAGFFDGEGCIVLASPGTGRLDRPRLDVGQVVRAPLDKLQAMYGGSVRALPMRNGWRQQHLWQSYQADEILTSMLPYLMVKTDQARLVLEYNALRSQLTGSGRRTPDEVRILLAEYKSRLAGMRYAYP